MARAAWGTAQQKPSKAGLLDRILSLTGTGKITHQLVLALIFHIEIDDDLQPTRFPCLWILSIWYLLRQSQGFGPRRKNPSTAFASLRVCCAFQHPQQCQSRSAGASFPHQGKEGAGLERLEGTHGRSSPRRLQLHSGMGVPGCRSPRVQPPPPPQRPWDTAYAFRLAFKISGRALLRASEEISLHLIMPKDSSKGIFFSDLLKCHLGLH